MKNTNVEPSVIGSGMAAMICGLLAHWLWSKGQEGNEFEAVGAALLSVLFIVTLVQMFGGMLNRARQAWREHEAAQVDDNMGSARWATMADVKKAGMLTGKILLGLFNKKTVCYPGETHLLTIGPPGSGKGVSIVIPNLLTCPYSMVVLDPKFELYAVTMRHRKQFLGHRIVCLCPFSGKLSEELGMEIIDDGFNPLSILKEGKSIKDEAELIASLLLPGSPRMSESDRFWSDCGKDLLVAALLYLKWQYGDVVLPMVRRFLMARADELYSMLCEMEQSGIYSGYLSELGSKLLATKKNSSAQFEGAMGMAQRSVRIYDSVGEMGAHVSRGSFDFASMKDTPTTVYIGLPGDRMASHGSWLNLVISLAMELVGRDRSNKKVLFLLDEFANAGYMPQVLRAMAQYRGQGLMVWPIVQSLQQLENKYGREGMNEFLALCDVVNAFGITDPQTLKLLSDWLGQKTVKQFARSVTPRQERSNFSHNYNASDVGVPLRRADEIRRMESDKQLLFFRNMPPLELDKIKYLKDNSLRNLAEPNPYHRK